MAALRGEGLAVRTVQHAHAVLRNMLQSAVRDEVLARNVARLVQVETPHYEIGQGLTVAQAKMLLEGVAGTRWHAIYGLALTLGLRRGELLGLRWADIDLESCQLTVRQSLVRAGGELRMQAPKTRKSVRTLPLPAFVGQLLRAHKERQAGEQRRARTTWAENGLVFTTAVGTPIEPRNLTRNFETVRERVGLTGVRLHDLRHTCITLLLGMGTPPHIVQAIAGHSHIDVTMSIYAHTRLDDQSKALSSLAAVLGPGR